MATAPKKRAPKTATTEVAAEEAAYNDVDETGPIGPDGEIRPVQIGRRAHPAEDLITIFELDGHEYKIPARPSVALVMRFLRQARDKRIGPDRAIENLLVALLGQDAFDALAESPDVTEEDVADVFTIVSHVAFGAVKKLVDASGN